MRESLFSPLWHRVAERRVRLRTNVEAQLQHHRDQTWCLLIAPTTGQQHRVNETGYQFIGRCDGERTVQEVWDSLLDALGDDAPTQAEVIRLLADLDQAELLRYDAAPDFPEVFRRKALRDRRRLRSFVNPLAFRVPLGNPSKLLARFDALGNVFMRPAAFWIWVGCVACALLAAAVHWPELRHQVGREFASPRHLMIAWVVFPCVKFLHELAHGLAVRRWGAEVREMGITLFVLVPAPYVDASAAGTFRHRRQRIAVSAAGIMVELGIACIALGCWLTVQPGLVRDFAFVTLLVCSISTLLFNGNPLLRFDGYYILCDALDLANLATRSRAYWVARLGRILHGAEPAVDVEPGRGERKWLELYAPLAFLNALLIGAAIVLWLGSVSAMLGVVAAAYVAIVLVVRPLLTTLGAIFRGAPAGRPRRRAGATIAATTILVAALLVAVPLPFYTTAQGVVWVPERAQVRPETEGFIRDWTVRSGEAVQLGQVLVVLDDPKLHAERAKLRSRLVGLETEQYSALLREPARLRNILQDIEQVQGELARVEQRIELLQVRSQVAGVAVIPRQDDLRGTLARKGHVLGYVLDQGAPRVRAAVPEGYAALVRERTHAVEVRLVEALGQTWRAAVEMDVPAAGRQLPSEALGNRSGGELAVDPSDAKGLRTMEPFVLVDLRLPAVVLRHIGERAWIRFDHGKTPLAEQVFRRLKLLLLRHFNPSG